MATSTTAVICVRLVPMGLELKGDILLITFRQCRRTFMGKVVIIWSWVIRILD